MLWIDLTNAQIIELENMLQIGGGGNKIPAIKVLKDMTKLLGLAEAKDAIEHLMWELCLHDAPVNTRARIRRPVTGLTLTDVNLCLGNGWFVVIDNSSDITFQRDVNETMKICGSDLKEILRIFEATRVQQ